MSWIRIAVCLFLIIPGVLGCGNNKTVIPTAAFTEEQKKAIQAEDTKVADEESHGAKRR